MSRPLGYHKAGATRGMVGGLVPDDGAAVQHAAILCLVVSDCR